MQHSLRLYFISAYRLDHGLGALTVQQFGPDLIRVTELLEETRMIVHTLDPECLIFAPDGINQVIIRYGNRFGIRTDIRQVYQRRRD